MPPLVGYVSLIYHDVDSQIYPGNKHVAVYLRKVSILWLSVSHSLVPRPRSHCLQLKDELSTIVLWISCIPPDESTTVSRTLTQHLRPKQRNLNLLDKVSRQQSSLPLGMFPRTSSENLLLLWCWLLPWLAKETKLLLAQACSCC